MFYLSIFLTGFTVNYWNMHYIKTFGSRVKFHIFNLFFSVSGFFFYGLTYCCHRKSKKICFKRADIHKFSYEWKISWGEKILSDEHSSIICLNLWRFCTCNTWKKESFTNDLLIKTFIIITKINKILTIIDNKVWALSELRPVNLCDNSLIGDINKKILVSWLNYSC